MCRQECWETALDWFIEVVRSLKNFPFPIIVGISNKARSTVDVKGVGRAETAV